jgi:phosphopantothenoylcysteine decarboxylase/phosphopantothenate--cysteine ligase
MGGQDGWRGGGAPPAGGGVGPAAPGGGASAPAGTGDTPSSPGDLLRGKRILLVVTGGVAAYKAVFLARLLVKAGAEVRTAMTEAAARFVTPLTFEAATGGEAVVDMWARRGAEVGHVAWARWADMAVVAPATADFVARMACGLAGDFAAATVLASEAPKLVCPAMNAGMYLNPATRANLDLLEARGATVAASPAGPLACGEEGPGRMAEPADVLAEAERLAAPKPLAGKRALVTSGATAEPWDDIRILTNRSSGRMGAELARAAWLMGAVTELVSGPSAADAGFAGTGFSQSRAGTCLELLEAVRERAGRADALVMNAAPADFRPAGRVPGKARKADGIPELPLARNPDVLTSVAPLKRPGAVWVGFAAEPEGTPPDAALAKLRAKSLDYIAVNATGGPESAFGGGLTALSVLDSSGRVILETPRVTKFGAAWRLLGAIFGGAGRP